MSDIKICIGCSIAFTPKWNKSVYCSISCSKQGKRNPRWKHETPTVICATCGTYFKVTDHPERERRFCSHRCSKIGTNNPMWNENVGYDALHAWVNRNLERPEKCECCGKKKPLDAANISNEYKRDLTDWEWLCRKCHMTKDGRMNNLKRGQQLTSQKNNT